jgi:hypothetical protein
MSLSDALLQLEHLVFFIYLYCTTNKLGSKWSGGHHLVAKETHPWYSGRPILFKR